MANYDKDLLTKIISLMDLTSLNDDDNDIKIKDFCQHVSTPLGKPAAICIYKEFINTAKAEFTTLSITDVKIATVTNFPKGADNINEAVEETKAAIAMGADEVDVVFPWQSFLAGNNELAFDLVEKSKLACNGKTLKVILETGELLNSANISKASEIAIAAGADFIKTSTGKTEVGATIEAAEAMLSAIKNSGKDNVGFKASGGIRTVEDATKYLDVANNIMGSSWVSANTFRFGVSGLLNNVLQHAGTTDNKLDSKY